MGSFNTVCALSHVSMDGDPAVFVPLVRGHFAKGTPINLNGDTAIVSNEGPYAFFVALCPPLFGRMTDYGRLEDVEDTPTARAVARAFGKSPQAFLDACGESQTASGVVYRPSEGYVPIEERVGGCFVHRRVWDEMSSRLDVLTRRDEAWTRASEACKAHFVKVHAVESALQRYRDLFDRLVLGRAGR